MVDTEKNKHRSFLLTYHRWYR